MTHIDSAAEAGQRRPRRGRSRGITLFIRDIVLILVAAIIISVGIKAFVIRSFYIPSESMEDTLQINDRIIVNEFVPHLIAVQRGDVVVFTDPGGWLPPAAPHTESPLEWALNAVGLSASDSDDHLVKRVIGLPGDKVACCNTLGQLTVNGSPLDEPYVKHINGGTLASATPFSVTVPKDSLWVMGDNRDNSEDSRFHADTPSKGFVPMDDVVGRAFVITWPTSRWTWLGDYPEVFDGVGK